MGAEIRLHSGVESISPKSSLVWEFSIVELASFSEAKCQRRRLFEGEADGVDADVAALAERRLAVNVLVALAVVSARRLRRGRNVHVGLGVRFAAASTAARFNRSHRAESARFRQRGRRAREMRLGFRIRGGAIGIRNALKAVAVGGCMPSTRQFVIDHGPVAPSTSRLPPSAARHR